MLNAQFYSTKKLPRQLEFKEDPHESEVGREVMREHGIFFYRDENHKDGVLVDPPVDKLTPAFYHQCILDEDSGFKIDEFNDPPASRLEKYGDALAWIVHNREQIVIEVRPDYVKVQA